MKQLLDIQQKLKAPKSQVNAFGKYRYRSCEDILMAVKPILADNKCVLTLRDDVLPIGDRVYVKATATLRDDKGAVIAETTAWAREEESKKGMDASQITGTASSYARKYALNGLFCIDDTKDADALNVSEEYTSKLPQALKELDDAATADAVAKVWRKYKDLQKDVQFKNAVAEKGTALKQIA